MRIQLQYKMEGLSPRATLPTASHHEQDNLQELRARLEAAARMHAVYKAYGADVGGLKTFGSRPSSANSLQNSISRLHDERANICRVLAHVNGSLSSPVTIIARTFQDLLDKCTAKLELTHSARRIFDRRGLELRNEIDLSMLGRDAEIFVSTGELFRDPIAAAQQRLLRVERAALRAWGDPAPAPRSRADSSRSEHSTALHASRIQTLLAAARPRALVFRLGEGRHGVEVVQVSRDRLLEECTSRLRLATPARRIFDLLGRELQDLPSELCAQSLFWLLGRIVGPLWVSTGPSASLQGPRRFVRELKTRLVARRKAVDTRLALYASTTVPELDLEARRLDHLQDIEKMTVYQLRAHADQLNATLEYLDETRQALEAAHNDSSDDDTCAVPAISERHRILGKPALRLRVYVNGCEPTEINEHVVNFDVAAAQRSLQAGDTLLSRLLEACTAACKAPSKGRRLFLQTGVEVESVEKLRRNDGVWLSCGEPFVPLTQAVLDTATAEDGHLLVCTRAKGSHSKPMPSQRWALHRQTGGQITIRPASSPNVALTVSASDSEPPTVVLQPLADPPAALQLWTLGPSGTIVSVGLAGTALTWIPTPSSSKPSAASEHSSLGDSGSVGIAGTDAGTLALHAVEGPGGRGQRWGVGPDVSRDIGLRRQTVTANPQPGLARLALLWPMLPSGACNDELPWPLLGSMVAAAPWIDTAPVVRLHEIYVVLNGTSNPKATQAVRVPPLRRPGDLQAQLIAFLDECARALKLTRSPRVLYDSHGKVVQDLGAVDPDQTHFVSFGELFAHRNRKKYLRHIRQELEQLYSYRSRAFPPPLVLSCHDDLDSVFAAALESNTRWKITDSRLIQSVHRDGLVLEATLLEPGAAVLLRPAADAEVRQKWVAGSEGYIQTAMDAALVLAVKDCGGAGSQIVLARKAEALNANEKWRLESTTDGTCIIHAYAASAEAVMLTAAHVCTLCTFSVSGPRKALQLAYGSETSPVCGACQRLQANDEATLQHCGVFEFVCSAGQAAAAQLQTPEDCGPSNTEVRLGSRVQLGSLASCYDVIGRWTKEEEGLQPTAQAARPATETAEEKARLKVRLFRNGSSEEAKSTLVLMPRASTSTQMVDFLLSEATARLRLTSAARSLFTAGGRLVTVLDLRQADLCPDAEGALPPLWVSCGEPYLDPSKEADMRSLKQEIYQLKKRLRDLCDRLGMQAGGQPSGFASQEERALFVELEEGRLQLRQKQTQLDRLTGVATLDETSRLAQARRAVRVRVRRNGAAAGAWKVCWGATLQELLSSCNDHLGVMTRKLYTSRGLPVTDVASLRVDQHLYASGGEAFVDHGQSRVQLKARADFAKSLKMLRSTGSES